MGGSHSRNCNTIARETILWCRERNISLTITHLPGKLNVVADETSRVFHDNTEWSLDIDIVSRQDKSAPTLPQAVTDWMSCVRRKLEDKGVTGEPLQILLASWREGTRKQYCTKVDPKRVNTQLYQD